MTGLEFIFFVLRRAIERRAISEAELHRIINTTADFVGLYAPVDGPEPEEIQKLCDKMHRINDRMEQAHDRS